MTDLLLLPFLSENLIHGREMQIAALEYPRRRGARKRIRSAHGPLHRPRGTRRGSLQIVGRCGGKSPLPALEGTAQVPARRYPTGPSPENVHASGSPGVANAARQSYKRHYEILNY